MSPERRHDPRIRILRRGRIVFRGGFAVIDCIVLDLSAGGARLRVGDWLNLPAAFELRLENGPVYKALVCFREMEVTGVRFVTDVAA